MPLKVFSSWCEEIELAWTQDVEESAAGYGVLVKSSPDDKFIPRTYRWSRSPCNLKYLRF